MFKSFASFTLAALLPLVTLTSFAQSAALPANVQRALQASQLPADALSLAMIPLNGNGKPVYYNADVAVNPASTMKLVTTYAALEMLGPAYQWKTELFTDGAIQNGTLNGNLYFKGGGDPKLNMEKLWLLLRDLRAQGVQNISGDLVLDRSYFRLPPHAPFDDDGGDANKPFLVGPDSLLVNLKSVRMFIRTEGANAVVKMDPPLDAIRLDNQVQATAPGTCPRWPHVRFTPVAQGGATTLVARGQIPRGCSGYVYTALLDHPDYAAKSIRGIWKELNGSIQGRDRLGAPPRNARLLVQAFSPDLTEIIRDINKYSNNTMAQQLFLSLGAQFRSGGDRDDAQAADRVIRQWLTRKGIRPNRLVLENGSGLSRKERISAREMAGMLQAAWNSPYAAEFIASMPLAAMDGTMRNRLKNTPVVGQAHIKTGTLNTVRAIAGISRDARGNSWAVVAILNTPRPWGTTPILDQALISLFQ